MFLWSHVVPQTCTAISALSPPYICNAQARSTKIVYIICVDRILSCARSRCTHNIVPKLENILKMQTEVWKLFFRTRFDKSKKSYWFSPTRQVIRDLMVVILNLYGNVGRAELAKKKLYFPSIRK